MKDASEILRALPSIEKLVNLPEKQPSDLIRPIRVRLAQELISEVREEALKSGQCPALVEIQNRLEQKVDQLREGGLRKVINATGVVLHTNLGRAALGKSQLERMASTLDGYCTLEFDLKKGERGSRTAALERYIRLYCNVDSALAVNNNAASVFLILHALAAPREVVISRGELIQIGGGFRIPEILAASGARLVEVGTTNMTHAKDYAGALGSNTAMVLKVHQSNFAMTGHTEEATMDELSAICKKAGICFVVDLGSGYLQDAGMGTREPTLESILRSGADLVCFSGDKLVGGPQAGIIVGKKQYVDALKKSPLYRALRLGKTELFLLENVFKDLLHGKKATVWEQLSENLNSLNSRCQQISRELKSFIPSVMVVPGISSVGGGTMPDCEIETFLIEIRTSQAEALARKLRKASMPVVARIEKDRLLLDLRTVFPPEERSLVESLREAWGVSASTT